MRTLLLREPLSRRWVPMICTPACSSSSSSCCSTSSPLHRFCSCSLPLLSDPSAEPCTARAPGLPSPAPAMLDQAQKARMARNQQQALNRLQSKQYFVKKQPIDTPVVASQNQSCRQLSSFPGVTSFPYAQQHQYNAVISPNSEVMGDCVDVERLQLVIDSTEKSQQVELPWPASSLQEFDYVVVIDFEATCDKNLANIKPQEIIEFPSVLVDCRQLTLGNCFQTYVRPVHHPVLTEFCTHLTGIQQEQVDKGMLLADAIFWHDAWLEQNGIKQANFAVLIWSDWDCKIMLESECNLKGLNKPLYFNRWINLKAIFQSVFDGKKCNLRKAVETAGLKWMGRAHCGLDDAKNTARLAVELMRRGAILKVTGWLDPQALVANLRRPAWPGPALQGQLTSDPSNYVNPQDPYASVAGNIHAGFGILHCFCGVACKRHVVKKPGPTQGKNFFACGKWTPIEGCRCGFFEWAAS